MRTTHPRLTIGAKLPIGNEGFVTPRKKPTDEPLPSKVWGELLAKQTSLIEMSKSVVRAPAQVVSVAAIATVDQAVAVGVENPAESVQHQVRV
jgi:hypothetical protein